MNRRELYKLFAILGKAALLLLSLRDVWFPESQTLLLLQGALVISLVKDLGTTVEDVRQHKKGGADP
jgi:hypothetical protein